MRLAFPTRPGPIEPHQIGRDLGEPLEAEPCTGHESVVAEDTCVFCGHLPHATIRRTWEKRAQVVAVTEVARR